MSFILYSVCSIVIGMVVCIFLWICMGLSLSLDDGVLGVVELLDSGLLSLGGGAR